MNEKILVVDDDLDVLAFLSRLLTQEGYQVKTASCGRDAVEAFRSEPVELVITDIRMPGMDGIEVMRRLKELNEYVEIIVLTGFATTNNAVLALKGESGAFDYLTKPLNNIDNLFNTVRQALEKRKLKLENKALISELKKEIEARRNAAELIRKSKILLQSVVDGIPEPLLMLDRDLSVKILNRAGTRYFQIGFKDAVGRTCEDILKRRNPSSEKCDGCEIRSSVLTETKITLERKNPFDVNRVEQVDVYPLREREMGGAIVRISDITEKKRIQEQLTRADFLSALGRLSGGIAHEIRNPLAGMNLFLDILSDEEKFDLSDEAREILCDVKDGVIKIEEIVKGVIDFAQPSGLSSGIEINPLVIEAVRLSDKKMRNSNIELTLSLAEGLAPVSGNRIGLMQAINNLIVNAIESIRGLGAIDISTCGGMSSFHETREVVIIKIKDSGTGINPEYLKTVFIPFFTTKTRNTGLGLTISNQIMERHGGIVLLDSSISGKGTIFTIELPVAEVL